MANEKNIEGNSQREESACLWSNRTRTGGQAMFPGRKRFETVQQCGRRGAYSLPDSTGEQERRDDCLRHCDENIDSSWSARVNRGMWILGAGNRPRLVSSIVAEFDSEMWQPLVSVAILQTVRLPTVALSIRSSGCKPVPAKVERSRSYADGPYRSFHLARPQVPRQWCQPRAGQEQITHSVAVSCSGP